MKEKYEMTSPKLVCFGNPLLDLIIEGSELVEKYRLQPNTAQEVDTIENGMYNEAIERDDCGLSSGGCALNTARVFQWLSSIPNQVAFIGGIGEDEIANKLKALMFESGVIPAMAVHTNLPTGHCIAMVHDKERTLAANLGAASKFDPEHFSDHHKKLISNCQVVYMEGYFLAHSSEVGNQITDLSRTENKKLLLNLNGEYVCRDHKFVQDVSRLLPNVDFLFGNREEYKVFLETTKNSTITNNLIIQELEKSLNSEEYQDCSNLKSITASETKHLVVFITDGSQNIEVHLIPVSNNKKVEVHSSLRFKVPVPKIESSKIKDTIGAGDSFVAGCIEALLEKNAFLMDMVQLGIYAAQTMIQQVGTNLPNHPPKFIQVPMNDKPVKDIQNGVLSPIHNKNGGFSPNKTCQNEDQNKTLKNTAKSTSMPHQTMKNGAQLSPSKKARLPPKGNCFEGCVNGYKPFIITPCEMCIMSSL